ncbi:MAG: flagellar hook-associated protein FlgK, partial [Hyphomonadaceae bacterium]|nr:flagellar hook-associated protein FlgK [Clostridia bacterium]
MAGSFGGLEIARSGLYISQKALDITSKNIANANTVGYTRQRVVSTPAVFNMGVQFTTVEQIRDKFLDVQYRNELNQSGEWSVKTEALTMMEDFLQEPSDTGINQAVGEFFNAIQQMSKQPETKEFRTQVRQNAINLTETLQYQYQKFTEIQQNQNESIKGTVSQINTLAENIRALNAQIVKLGTNGEETNELNDQRNNLIDQLTELVDIRVTEQSDKTVSIEIGGKTLVEGNTAHKLTTTQDKENPIADEPMLDTVRWEEDGEQTDIIGGKLKGYMDIRDGNGVLETDDPKAMGVPYFIAKFNVFAKAIAEAVNTIHTQGYTQPNESNGNVSTSGHDFFVAGDGQTEVTAKNIKISDAIMSDVYNIAASDETLNALNMGNKKIISQISDLRDSKIKVDIGGIT